MTPKFINNLGQVYSFFVQTLERSVNNLGFFGNKLGSKKLLVTIVPQGFTIITLVILRSYRVVLCM